MGGILSLAEEGKNKIKVDYDAYLTFKQAKGYIIDIIFERFIYILRTMIIIRRLEYEHRKIE